MSSRRQSSTSVARLDGARHWRRTLRQYLTLLQVASVTPAQIRKVTNATLRQKTKIKTLQIPTIEELQYPRILTHWQVAPKFLDEHGVARELELTGGKVSFAALVREALPGSTPAAVLRVLESHRLVKRVRRKVVMLSGAFVPPGQQLGHSLAYTLTAVEGILGTGYSNMMRRDPKHRVGRLQQMAFAERFDFAYLPDYDQYMRQSAEVMLKRHDAFLKRREAPKGSKGRKVGHVGVIICAVRAR